MNNQQSDLSAARTSAMAGELRVLIGKLSRKLREQIHAGEYTPSQLSLLRRLESDGPATVTTLARAEGMRSQSMGAIVSVLEEAGMVSGAPDPSDGRQTIWSLTPSFVEAVAEGRAARENWLDRAIQAKLGPEEQAELASAIQLLKRLVDS